MECFTICGWWSSAVSEARTDLNDGLKVLGGKAVEDPTLKTLQVGQILSQPSSADPSQCRLPAFGTEGLPFTQEFYSVIEPSYGRFASPFPYESRPDPVCAGVMIGVLLGCLPKLLQFEVIRHLEALCPMFRLPSRSRRHDVASTLLLRQSYRMLRESATRRTERDFCWSLCHAFSQKL